MCAKYIVIIYLHPHRECVVYINTQIVYNVTKLDNNVRYVLGNALHIYILLETSKWGHVV